MILKWLEKKCYPEKPQYATSSEWREWDKIEKAKPICNFFVNTFPDFIKYKITRRITDAYYWILYRTCPRHKYQLIDTGLKPGYYEYETRIFYAAFNAMQVFCEREQPYHDWCWKYAGEKYKEKFIPGFEAALESFKWRKELVYKEEEMFGEWGKKNKHLIGQPTPQADSAKELEEIYLWWVKVFKNRLDPYIVFPDDYRNDLKNNDSDFYDLFEKRPSVEEDKFWEMIKLRDELEKQYEQEDEEMLIRLIKIRKHLWT